MISLRAILVWVMMLSLPVQGIAATSMTHCKGMPAGARAVSGQLMAHHDHAAMMAAMAASEAATMMPMHGLHTMHSGKAGKGFKLGCQCGCKCGGDCAMSCAGMMAAAVYLSLPSDYRSDCVSSEAPCAQAHAAYRYDPLRPPSAVAI